MAARAIIAESPAEHTVGSKPPGTDLAVAAMRQLEGEAGTRKAQREGEMAGSVAAAAPVPTYEGPEVA